MLGDKHRWYTKELMTFLSCLLCVSAICGLSELEEEVDADISTPTKLATSIM